MSPLLPSCADTARRLSEAQDHPLTLGLRCGVTIHLALCRYCRRYRRQLRFLRTAHQALRDERGGDIHLPTNARRRIIEHLEQLED